MEREWATTDRFLPSVGRGIAVLPIAVFGREVLDEAQDALEIAGLRLRGGQQA